MMRDQHIRSTRCRLPKTFQISTHRQRHTFHFRTPDHLHPIRAIISKCFYCEIGVEILDNIIAQCSHFLLLTPATWTMIENKYGSERYAANHVSLSDGYVELSEPVSALPALPLALWRSLWLPL